jgi:hypothetical protein
MKKFTLSLLLCLLATLSTNVIAQNLSQSINQQLTQLLEKDDLLPQDIQWKMTSNHVSSVSGIQHGYYSQLINGIQVYGTESGIHLTPSGSVLTANNRFVNKTVDKLRTTTPSLNAIQAVQAASSQLNYTISEALSVIESNGGASQETLLSGGGMSLSPIPAKLMYQLNDNNELILVWDLSIQERNQQNWWNVRVDANTGTIIDKNDYMVSCSFDHDHSADSELNFNKNLYDIPNYKELVATNAAGCTECYEVIAMPIESPYYGVRTIEVQPAYLAASPFGWHDTDGVTGAEFTETRGNNADAYDDGNNPGYQPDGGASLNFTGYPFSEIYTNSNQYEDAAISNLFYWNNIIHDLMYVYGFDEVGGNFQENNYGNGGLGSDYVNAEAQDGSGTCNANFGTPPDGSNPTMQMYVCGDKDGDFDNLVIVHEYGHGISNRLTGGPANTGCLNNQEQMGEGWSDFYGVLMTIEPGDTGTDPRGVGTYLFGQGPGGPGIRPFPYSTDFAVNPQTYNSIIGAAVPHGVGSVWATIMWEVTWELIGEYGYDPDFYNFTGDVNVDAGNVQAFALVTEGMKLQPCSPGFVDGRDAIFAADLAIYGGANECLLWDAFARRGLGFSANQGSSGSTSDGTEAFDSPVPAINTAEEVCVGAGVQVFGGGTPAGGVYSGTGVTDDGNGLTYTFDPAVAGVGIHAIGYDVTTSCATGTAFDDLEVTPDEPEVLCQDVTLELDINGEATLTIYDIVTNLEPGALVVDQTGTFAPIDITATGTTVSLSDDSVSGALPVGFDFSYYGIVYNNFYISSNGFLTFNGSSGNGCCSGGVIPSSGDENNLIALVWEDLNPASGGTIRYETVGTAPDRKLVMEYDAVPFYGSSDAVTTQVQLFETSNRIEIHSTLIPANGNATMGIENQDGSMGLPVPGRNSQTWSCSNDYVAFYYAPGGPADNCGTATTISLSQTLFTCDDRPSSVVTVTVTDGDGNVGTCTPTVTISDPLGVCPPLGLEDNIFDQNISIFPNPSNSQITIVNNSNSEIKTITITDINGRTIQNLNVDNATTRSTFSIESLSQGMYFVKIEAENNSTVKRIVKN